MCKINKYLILLQSILLNVIGQNSIQCAARIQTEKILIDSDLELVTAAFDGDKDKVEELIKTGANVNATDGWGDTALIHAAREGHKEIVKLLLHAEAEVNAIGSKGRSALLQSAWDGDKKTVELLINAKANIELDNGDGDTALILSIKARHTEVTELLIKSGANVDYALITAVKLGNKEIVDLLMRAGADIDMDSIAVISNCLMLKKAIDFAHEYNQAEIVEIIEQEKPRREVVVKKWIKENLAKKINQTTSGQLIPNISQLIAEYAIEYNDLPLEYRLANS